MDCSEKKNFQEIDVVGIIHLIWGNVCRFIFLKMIGYAGIRTQDLSALYLPYLMSRFRSYNELIWKNGFNQKDCNYFHISQIYC